MLTFPVALAASGDSLVTLCTQEICAAAPFLSLCCTASRARINLLFPWDSISLKSGRVSALPSAPLEQALELVLSQLNPAQALKHSISYSFLVS